MKATAKKLKTAEGKERRPLTEIELREAAQLKRYWEKIKTPGNRDISQRGLAAEYGANETLVSQHMNGVIPIPIEWKLRYARYLNCLPQNIWPEWEFSDLTPGPVSPAAARIAVGYSNLAPKDQNTVNELINRFQR